VPTGLIEEFAATLSQFGIEAAPRCQRALADFIDCGDFYRHIRCGRRRDADRRRVPLGQIEAKLSRWRAGAGRWLLRCPLTPVANGKAAACRSVSAPARKRKSQAASTRLLK